MVSLGPPGGPQGGPRGAPGGPTGASGEPKDSHRISKGSRGNPKDLGPCPPSRPRHLSRPSYPFSPISSPEGPRTGGGDGVQDPVGVLSPVQVSDDNGHAAKFSSCNIEMSYR